MNSSYLKELLMTDMVCKLAITVLIQNTPTGRPIKQPTPAPYRWKGKIWKCIIKYTSKKIQKKTFGILNFQKNPKFQEKNHKSGSFGIKKAPIFFFSKIKNKKSKTQHKIWKEEAIIRKRHQKHLQNLCVATSHDSQRKLIKV